VSFPNKVLTDGEKVVEHLHPHWITLVPATLWFLVLTTAAGFGIGFSANKTDGTTQLVLIAIIVIAWIGLISWLSVGPWLRNRMTHYVFTDRRILIREGILHHTGRDIALQRITDVGFSQTLWDRIVNAGTLTIESAGESGRQTLEDVPHSEQQQQLINRLVEADQSRRNQEASQHFTGGMPPQQGGYNPTQQFPPPGPTQQI